MFRHLHRHPCHDRRRFHRGEGGFHPGHGHRRGGRGGRVFETGDLRLVLLRLIAERPRHGYELIKAIEERLGGSYAPSPGTIYPTLTLLEEMGHIAIAGTDGARKLYAITPEGQAALDAARPEVDALLARMDAIAGDRPAAAAQSVMRAMHNLKLALRLRLSRGDLSEAALRAVVAAIDEAAVKVETTR